MRSRCCAAVVLAATTLTGCVATSDTRQAAQRIIRIRGGQVIDGTEAPRRAADVLIEGDRIAAIGNIDAGRTAGAQVIDAAGMVVTPGFIDPHAHGDPLEQPAFENFLAMGVTTICLGQDGESAESIVDWMGAVERAGPAANIATFVGHGTIRKLAGVGLRRNPSKQQIARMQALVREAIRHGCLGLTTGLEYQSGSFANINELIALARPVAKTGGLVMSHLRSEDDDAIDAALDELFSQCGESGSPAHISHIKVVYGQGAPRAERILAKMAAARAQGRRVTADIYPYNASFTGIGIVFPTWAKPFEEVLIDEIGPSGAQAAYFVMDADLQERLLADPHVMISSDGSPTMRHPRGHGAFARVIREYVVEREFLSLEEAVRKMTDLPAQTTGLARLRRGRLAPGYAADVLVFDPRAVRDNATYANPHIPASGFAWVIVNGQIARERDRATGIRAGRMLRR